jgi:DMSO/TMAO reductase YedYZ molybdopterin-dependent catalytic subunit
MRCLSALFWRRKREEKPRERLPPRQRWVPKILGWGVEHPGIVRTLPVVEKTEWSLEVSGEIENPRAFTWDEFMALPQTESVSDFHCVETWSVKDQRWEGVKFNDLMEEVRSTREASHVSFECYDGYATSLPIEELRGDDVILAHRLNGEDLPQPLGGPMRLVVPQKYAYKSAMWLNRIVFMKRDKLGYWESGMYSNTADPWRNDRYRLR